MHAHGDCSHAARTAHQCVAGTYNVHLRDKREVNENPLLTHSFRSWHGLAAEALMERTHVSPMAAQQTAVYTWCSGCDGRGFLPRCAPAAAFSMGADQVCDSGALDAMFATCVA